VTGHVSDLLRPAAIIQIIGWLRRSFSRFNPQ